ncbi:hypothetical protein [Streptomyces sp. WMMB 322]|uniref:hypothetical protein n=1 Tax=Streptomyces sp. WMMB 322 TaxID=1286821 RepID=UPI0006E4401A|nr:hypothetical protein [Streptomyces sp. WMMB 322]SCK33049.1 hypothetical protein H180DRAFT_02665 [Streptomyces sp. WMMB 322]
MNDQSRDDAANKSRTPLSSNKLMLLWFGAILVVAVCIWVGLVLTKTSDPASATYTVAGICVFMAAVVDIATRNKRRNAARRNATSIEEARGRIDAAEVRALKDKSGEVRAVKAVRSQVPGLSLTDAVQLVRSL